MGYDVIGVVSHGGGLEKIRPLLSFWKAECRTELWSHYEGRGSHCLLLLDARTRAWCCSTRFRQCLRLFPTCTLISLLNPQGSLHFSALPVHFLRTFFSERW